MPTTHKFPVQYDSVEDEKAITALKYMLLSKIMLNVPDEVSLGV